MTASQRRINVIKEAQRLGRETATQALRRACFVDRIYVDPVFGAVKVEERATDAEMADPLAFVAEKRAAMEQGGRTARFYMKSEFKRLGLNDKYAK